MGQSMKENYFDLTCEFKIRHAEFTEKSRKKRMRHTGGDS
jgi:hypothetical protein